MKVTIRKLIQASVNGVGLIKSYKNMPTFIAGQNDLHSAPSLALIILPQQSCAFRKAESKKLYEECGKKKLKMLKILCMMILTCIGA